MAEKKEVIINEGRQDSIEVACNAKGDYSWKIKVYLDSREGKDTKKIDVVAVRLSAVDKDLRKRFG